MTGRNRISHIIDNIITVYVICAHINLILKNESTQCPLNCTENVSKEDSIPNKWVDFFIRFRLKRQYKKWVYEIQITQVLTKTKSTLFWFICLCGVWLILTQLVNKTWAYRYFYKNLFTFQRVPICFYWVITGMAAWASMVNDCCYGWSAICLFSASYTFVFCFNSYKCLNYNTFYYRISKSYFPIPELPMVSLFQIDVFTNVPKNNKQLDWKAVKSDSRSQGAMLTWFRLELNDHIFK